MVYLIAFIAAVIGAWLNSRMTPVMRKSFLIILCVYVILVVGFRYKVGIDTLLYMNNYRYIPGVEDFFLNRTASITRFEPGFLFLCCVCKSFGAEFWVVQMVVATIANTCIFIFIYRNCTNPFWGLLFYFFLQFLYFNTEIMRESLALSIFLLNYRNLKENRLLLYYLLCPLSIIFHYSAIIILFFPFARWLKLNFVFIILCICFLAITPLVENLNALLNIAAISGRVTQYVEGAEDLNFNWRLAELVKAAFPAIFALICYRICKAEIPNRQMLLLQILFCMGAFAIPIIFSRFTNYTALFVTVACANLMSLPSAKRWLKALFVAGIILTQSFSYYSMYDRWFPYVSIFYPEPHPVRGQLYRHHFLQWKKY